MGGFIDMRLTLVLPLPSAKAWLQRVTPRDTKVTQLYVGKGLLFFIVSRDNKTYYETLSLSAVPDKVIFKLTKTVRLARYGVASPDGKTGNGPGCAFGGKLGHLWRLDTPNIESEIQKEAMYANSTRHKTSFISTELGNEKMAARKPT